jgi:crossover junction endodeoxyribonuclease RuvC
MIVLGVDPGLSMCGWGVVSRGGQNLSMLDYGCVKTAPASALPMRLRTIYETLNSVIEKYSPQVMAIEELFFSKEARTVAAVAQARGVILLCASSYNLPVCEYNPRHVKISLTGYGSAEKQQIQHMVKAMLGLPTIPKPDDAADALAIAITHLNTAESGYAKALRSAH